MAKQLNNEFSSYDLTEDEVVQGSILSIAQKHVLQNKIAVAASEKLAIEFDVNNPNTFIQQEAYKKGELAALQFMLETSTSLEAELEFRLHQQ